MCYQNMWSSFNGILNCILQIEILQLFCLNDWLSLRVKLCPPRRVTEHFQCPWPNHPHMIYPNKWSSSIRNYVNSHSNLWAFKIRDFQRCVNWTSFISCLTKLETWKPLEIKMSVVVTLKLHPQINEKVKSKTISVKKILDGWVSSCRSELLWSQDWDWNLGGLSLKPLHRIFKVSVSLSILETKVSLSLKFWDQSEKSWAQSQSLRP